MSFKWPLNCSLINSFDPFHWPKCSRSRNYLYTKYTAIAFFAVLSINKQTNEHVKTPKRQRHWSLAKKIPISHTCATDHLYSTVFVLFCFVLLRMNTRVLKASAHWSLISIFTSLIRNLQVKLDIIWKVHRPLYINTNKAHTALNSRKKRSYIDYRQTETYVRCQWNFWSIFFRGRVKVVALIEQKHSLNCYIHNTLLFTWVFSRCSLILL